MKATITNINRDYFYTIENIVQVLYINNEIELIYKDENDKLTSNRYNAKEVMISIY